MRFANPSKKTKVHASTKGHAIEFPGRVAVDAKGKPPEGFKLPEGAMLSKEGLVYVHVPPLLHAEVKAAGFEPESEMEDGDEPTLPKKPESSAELETELFAAFDVLVESARREDFAFVVCLWSRIDLRHGPCGGG